MDDRNDSFDLDEWFTRYHYILDDNGEPRRVTSAHEYMSWVMGHDGAISVRLARDTVGDAEVSTIFLTIDHSMGMGRPILYETMVFGGMYDSLKRQYHTKQEALAGHVEILRMLHASNN